MKTVTFKVREHRKPSRCVEVTGEPISILGVPGFAVHKRAWQGYGLPWSVSHVETGGMVEQSITRDCAIAKAEEFAKKQPDWNTMLQKAVAKAKARIRRAEIGVKTRKKK